MRLLIDALDYSEKGMPPHKHNVYEILTYTCGAGCLHIAGRDFSVKAGDMIVIPPGITHGTTTSSKLQSIYINGIFNQNFSFFHPLMLTDNAGQEGFQLVNMIYKNRHESPEYVHALCNACIHFILRNLKAEDPICTSVRKIIHAITENFDDSTLNPGDLLTASGYAKDYVRAHFKEITKKTPNAFLAEIRIKHACFLIDVYRNSLSLSEIAQRCGYTDYIYFSRKFKQIMGMSPQKYKNML